MKSLLKNSYIKIFLLGFLCAFCLLLPFFVIDKGFFVYSVDFNHQQLPFMTNAMELILNGNLNWNWAADLGSSAVTSLSFFPLGSPFFWFSCLFSGIAVPYVNAFMVMLRYAVTALGAYCFLRRYAKTNGYAYTAALIYTFSGFNIYNLFFQFLDAIALFPFLLWSLDEYVYNKRRGMFVVFVALNLLNNYFFFIGEVVFLFIYFICKAVNKDYIVTVKEFFLLAFESILGCLCGIVICIPTIFNLLQNPRSTEFAGGISLLIYDKIHQYFAIAMSAFFPPEVPYNPNIFTSADVYYTSLSAFLVLGGMFGFFVFLKYFRKSSFTKIFICCIVFAFIPVLNSSFYAFNDNYYARWYFMPLLILTAMNMHSFCLEKEKIFYGLKLTALCTCAFCIFALIPGRYSNGSLRIGIQNNMWLFWLYFAIAVFSLAVTYITVKHFAYKKIYTQRLTCSAMVLIVLFGYIHIALTKLPHYEFYSDYKTYQYDAAAEIENYGNNSRLDIFYPYANAGFVWNKPVIQSFNSTVTPSIMSFYPYVGVTREVSSMPDYSNYPLRSLLSVEHMLVSNNRLEEFISKGYDNIYSQCDNLSDYTVFENNYYIPMGFTYDNYITYHQLENVAPADRSHIMMRALLADETTINQNGNALDKLDNSSLADLSFETFCKDVEDRKSECSYSFEMTDYGFVSRINLEKDNFVFYSVPYDEGFKAYINGEESEIFNVNNGLSAVYATKGENEIVFRYETPYIKAGIFLNLFGLSIYIIYSVLIIKKKVKI